MENPWKNAAEQLRVVSEVAQLSKAEFELLTTHDRVVERELRIVMDGGEEKKFRAFRAQHNNVLGPYKGGLRFHLGVSRDEVKALSMWMSWKTAVAGLPFGGGKGGVVVDPRNLSQGEFERLSRAWVKEFYDVIGPEVDVPAPDVNTNPAVMEWMSDEYVKIKKEEILRQSGAAQRAGSAQDDKLVSESLTSLSNEEEVLVWRAAFTGKPVNMGGSQGRVEATGRGGFYVLQELVGKLGRKPSEMTVAVQGLGNVGYWFAKLACEAGYRVIAISDSKGAILKQDDSSCIDFDQAVLHKKKHGSLEGLEGMEFVSNEQLLELPVDVLVPAALENVITAENAGRVRASIVVEMANGPVTPKADVILNDKGVMVVPDVLANCGGVTVSYFEWRQNMLGERWTEEEVNQKLKKSMHLAFVNVWNSWGELKTKNLGAKFGMRMAAYVYAVGKILGRKITTSAIDKK